MALTIEKMDNGAVDLQTLDDFIHSSDPTTTTRLGQEIPTVSGLTALYPLAHLHAEVGATGTKFFDTIALGRAAVADTETFGVKASGSDGLLRPTIYRRDSSSTQTLLFALVPGPQFDQMQARLEARAGDFAWLGRETPIDGAGTAMAQGNWILDTPTPTAGYLKTFRVWAEATGTLKLRSFSKSGSDFTEVHSATITVGSTGLQEFTPADFGVFPVAAGEYMGLYTAGGLVSRTSTVAPLANSYRVQLGVEDATVTAATVFQNAIYEFGFEVPTEYLAEPVARFEAVEAQAQALDAALFAAQAIGVTTPAAGSNATIATYVVHDAALNAGFVKEVIAYSGASDRLSFSVYDKSGTTFTQSGEQVTVDVLAGSNTIPLNLPIAAGQYVGVSINTAGGITYNAGSTAFYFGALAGGSFAGTLSTADLQVRFNLRVSNETAGGGGLWFGKRIAFFGDSLSAESAGVTWPADLCAYVGATYALNDARSGTMMLDALDNTTSTTFNNIDAVVLAYGGTNDYGNNTTLGTIADAAGTGTFYAQTKLVIETFLGWKPTLTIKGVTSPQRTAAPAVSAGQTLLQYVSAFQEVCALYGLDVCDLYAKSGLNTVNMASETTDGLHLTIPGGETRHLLGPLKAFFNSTSP